MGETKYHVFVADRLCEVEDWAREGLSDSTIAQRLQISPRSLRRYVQQHADLALALKKGRLSDRFVEAALFKRAVGYQYEETKMEEVDNKRKRVATVKHVAPDISAATYWLKNRQPDRWHDKPPVLAPEPPGDDHFFEALDGCAKEVWKDWKGDEES